MTRFFALALIVTFVATLHAQTPQQIQDAITHLNAAIADLQPAAAGKTSTLSATGNLQAALDTASCGDTILLPIGATYPGAFTMAKTCAAAPITLASATTPPAGRISATAILPNLRLSSGASSVLTVSGTGYIVRGLDIMGGSDTVTVTGSQVVLDQNHIHGEDAVDHKRGVALNGDRVTVTNSVIDNFHVAGQDSQAICGWNGPGPYTIDNNDLEAASENILFGGADPSVQNLVPSNITITHNLLTKPLAWRSQSGWNIKNALELKNASHVVISGNVIEHVWSDAQAGYLVQFTVRNQDGGCPWCLVSDVQMTGNVFRHAGGWINFLGVDTEHPSAREAGLVITNNLAYDIDGAAWQGAAEASGRVLDIIGGPNGVEIGHNTVVGSQRLNSALMLGQVGDAFTTAGLNVHDNVLPEGTYGVGGDSVGIGVSALSTYAPGYVWTNNVLVRGLGEDGQPNHYDGLYPPTTIVSQPGQTVVNPDFTLVAGFSGGADIAALKSSIPGLDLTQ